MAKKNTIIAISVVASLAAGYLAGAYFGVPVFSEDEAAGSVNKARLSNSGKTDPEVLAAMELLQNDAQTQAKVSASALLLASRVSQMNDLAKSTAELSSNIESLKSVNEYMTSLSKRTGNAMAAFEEFTAEVVKVVDGKKSSNYEQASNNAILAFTVLENSIASCTECVWTLTDYLKSNKNDALAQATCKWMDFCAEDAVLNDSKQEMEKWDQVFRSISEGSLGVFFVSNSAYADGGIRNADVMSNALLAAAYVPDLSNADELTGVLMKAATVLGRSGDLRNADLNFGGNLEDNGIKNTGDMEANSLIKNQNLENNIRPSEEMKSQIMQNGATVQGENLRALVLGLTSDLGPAEAVKNASVLFGYVLANMSPIAGYSSMEDALKSSEALNSNKNQ